MNRFGGFTGGCLVTPMNCGVISIGFGITPCFNMVIKNRPQLSLTASAVYK